MDIVDRIVALESGAALHLSVADVKKEFGSGEAGLIALQEIAEDNDCGFEETDPLTVTITKFLLPRN